MDGTDGLKGGGFSSFRAPSGEAQREKRDLEEHCSYKTERDLQQGCPFRGRCRKSINGKVNVMAKLQGKKGQESKISAWRAARQEMPESKLAHPLHLHEKSRSAHQPSFKLCRGTALYARLCRQTVTKSTGHDEPALQDPIDACGCAAAMDAPWSGSWLGDAEVHEGVGQWDSMGAVWRANERAGTRAGRGDGGLGGLQRCMAGDMDGWMQMVLYLS